MSTADPSARSAAPDAPQGAPADASSNELKPSPRLTEHIKTRRKRRWLRRIGWTFLVLVVLLGIVRLAMPSTIRWYVNRTLDRSPLYDGKVGDITVHLWRGAYTIEDVKLIKTTGNVPVPLFAAKRVDLAIQWNALLHGSLVGRINIEQPELNFVSGPSDAESQGGGGTSAPWLGMIQDLFPFRINSAHVSGGSIHYQTFTGGTPVDVYLSQVDADLDNLTNIDDQHTPMVTTCTAKGLAMDQAQFEYEMRLDPFSYKPTFHLMMRLLGLDVTKLRDLTRHFGGFDFEHGWFDLVVEMRCTEGQIRGYVKPLFRNLQILSPQDVREDDPLQLFWEALVEGTKNVFKNQPRDQLGTLIPFTGDVTGPQPDIIVTIGNVLRNAFIRAYLPKLQHGQRIEGMQFQPPSLDEPATLLQ